MSIRIRSVTRSRNTIRFGQTVKPAALGDVISEVDEARSRGFEEVVLDFRRSNAAFPQAIFPLICFLDERRERGLSFKVLLPETAYLRQLFLNSNWAHHLDPSHPRIDLEHPQHLAARRYSSHPEQQEAVSAALDVVLRNMESVPREVISALEWSVNEITDNVLNHAQSPLGGLIQVSTHREDHQVKFVVADGGRGVPRAMRDAFPRLSDDEALGEAVKKGVTSIPHSGQGNGLTGSLRISELAKGSFRLAAGKAQLCVFRDPRTSKYKTQKGRPAGDHRFPGTLVMIEMKTDVPLDLGEALDLPRGHDQVASVVDHRYASGDNELVVRVADESLGTGTRHAGVELRRKCTTLLSAEPEKRLVLDWSGVPLVSSSFADEAIGKLFVELGPTTFMHRVTSTRSEPLVHSLLDRAILQRVAQTAGRNDDDSVVEG